MTIYIFVINFAENLLGKIFENRLMAHGLNFSIIHSDIPDSNTILAASQANTIQEAIPYRKPL